MKNWIVKTAILLGVLFVAIGCSALSGAAPTATRSARADATQTPIIIYVPVTTTPEPFTATPLPTVTGAAPTRTATRPPQPTAPPATRAPVAAATNTPVPAPTNTAAPACGQELKVAKLTFPEDGATRNTNPKGGPTIQFQFTPVVNYNLDSSIGYRVDMRITRTNGMTDARYMSHNKFLTTREGIVLDGKALWILSGGEDNQMQWTVTVIKASGGFDDNTNLPIGTVSDCGTPTGPYRVVIQVVL